MKYVPSAFIGQLSKSLGSTVASHNRFGSYFRNRVIPVDPSTAAQAQIRADMQDLSQAWKGLTAPQRAGWADLAAQMPRLDSQGRTYFMTGLQAFTSLNMLNRVVGVADLADAPAAPGAPVELTSYTAVYSTATGLDITFTPTPIGLLNRVLVEASRWVSAGVNFMPRSGYKLIFVGAVNGTSPQDLTASYQSLYGVAPVGTKVFFRFYVLDGNGFKGTPVKVSAIKTV